MDHRRNVVLVTIDSFRPDRCGFMGSERGLTPTLDRVAADGLIFENAIATAPATHGSAATFLTGNRPVEREGGESATSAYITDHMAARTSVAQQFSRLGYQTAAFTANPWTSRAFGFDDGFDHFEDFFDDSGATDADASNSGRIFLETVRDWWRGQDMFLSWDAFYDDVVAWMDSADQPFFLWIFLVDTHLPYFPPRKYRRRSLASTVPANLWLFADRDADRLLEPWTHDVLTSAYGDTVRYVDEFVDRMIGDLSGFDAQLVVHGDHGEAFGEHGMYGHGRQLYEELIHVPLLISGGPTGRVEQPFSLRNLPDLLLAGALEGDPTRHTDPWVVSSNRMPSTSVRGKGWKYVQTPTGEQLFDLDVGEHDDLLGTELDRGTRELLAIARDIRGRHERTQAERVRLVEAASSAAAGPEGQGSASPVASGPLGR